MNGLTKYSVEVQATLHQPSMVTECCRICLHEFPEYTSLGLQSIRQFVGPSSPPGIRLGFVMSLRSKLRETISKQHAQNRMFHRLEPEMEHMTLSQHYLKLLITTDIRLQGLLVLGSTIRFIQFFHIKQTPAIADL